MRTKANEDDLTIQGSKPVPLMLIVAVELARPVWVTAA